jgi:Fe-S cluster biogenesis protein NfuA
VTDTTALYDAVDKALDEIRPYITSHAGDVNIIDVSDAGVVKLQMVGHLPRLSHEHC